MLQSYETETKKNYHATIGLTSLVGIPKRNTTCEKVGKYTDKFFKIEKQHKDEHRASELAISWSTSNVELSVVKSQHSSS